MQTLSRMALALPLALIPAAAHAAGFPGATGYGATVADGGGGGAVIHVTTLADAIPAPAGSLRACVNASGARTCIFRVGGTITLAARLEILNGNLTVPCHTAPGGGIQIRGDHDVYIYQANDIIMQHCRIRPNKDTPGGIDALTFDGAQDIILRHMSLYYGSDENVSCTGSPVNDVTIQQSILAYGLESHSKSALLCNNENNNIRGFSLYKNLLAHSNDRNPEFTLTDTGHADVVNNVIYNWDSEAAEVKDGDDINGNGNGRYDFQNNYFRTGPNSGAGSCAVTAANEDGGAHESSIWLGGNTLDGLSCGLTGIAPAGARNKPATVSPVDTAAVAYSRVRTYAGAHPRDSLDTATVATVTNRTGSIITNPTTWPVLAGGTPYPDADADGMSDSWETANGVTSPTALWPHGGRCAGYHNLTCWLAQRHDDVVP